MNQTVITALSVLLLSQFSQAANERKGMSLANECLRMFARSKIASAKPEPRSAKDQDNLGYLGEDEKPKKVTQKAPKIKSSTKVDRGGDQHNKTSEIKKMVSKNSDIQKWNDLIIHNKSRLVRKLNFIVDRDMFLSHKTTFFRFDDETGAMQLDPLMIPEIAEGLAKSRDLSKGTTIVVSSENERIALLKNFQELSEKKSFWANIGIEKAEVTYADNDELRILAEKSLKQLSDEKASFKDVSVGNFKVILSHELNSLENSPYTLFLTHFQTQPELQVILESVQDVNTEPYLMLNTSIDYAVRTYELMSNLLSSGFVSDEVKNALAGNRRMSPLRRLQTFATSAQGAKGKLSYLYELITPDGMLTSGIENVANSELNHFLNQNRYNIEVWNDLDQEDVRVFNETSNLGLTKLDPDYHRNLRNLMNFVDSNHALPTESDDKALANFTKDYKSHLKKYKYFRKYF